MLARALPAGFVVAEDGRRLEERVDRDSEAVVEELGNDAREEGRAHLEAGVRVGLNQIHLEVVVNHKVVTEDFECVFVARGVDLLVDGAEGVRDQALHYGEQVPHETNGLTRVVLVQVALEVVDRELVPTLEFAVVLGIHLHRVVGEVHEARAQVAQVERLRGGAEVAVTVHVALKNAIHRC